MPKGGVVWTPAAVLAGALAVWMLAAGCVSGLAAIRQGVAEESEIFVVYGEGQIRS